MTHTKEARLTGFSRLRRCRLRLTTLPPQCNLPKFLIEQKTAAESCGCFVIFMNLVYAP